MRVIARAPTRIDFGGGWTDVPPYPERDGGFVCNLAIARHASASLVARTDETVIDDQGSVWRGRDLRHEGAGALVRASLRRAGIGHAGITLRADFPAGAGLGGSSAAGVAMVAAIAAFRGETPDRATLAERSRSVEVEELGVAGGRQDHYASAFGGALALTFGHSVTATPIPLDRDCRDAIERRCVIAYTGESRISGATITAVIDAYRDGSERVCSALASMKLLAVSMSEALARGDIDTLGALVGEHWVHQRSLHSRITTNRIEHLMRLGGAAGAIGGKALGASGGGCVLMIAANGEEDRLRSALEPESELLPFRVATSGVHVALMAGDVGAAATP